jgi:tetratricopeptide (TPR) repeat protein
MKMKKLIAMLALIVISVGCITTVASAETVSISDSTPYESYTYWTELSGANSRKVVSMKPLYEVDRVIYSSDMSSVNMADMEDIYCSDSGYTYILDSKIPAIVVLDANYKYVRTISELKTADSQSISFAGATGIYVTQDEKIYICGTASACVWVVDQEGVILDTLTLPDSNIIPDNFSYAPIKVTVDTNGYVYVLSDGSYYGAILYSPENEFVGFYGANRVAATASQVLKNIWNRLFVNDVKKEASVKALPYQFTDLEVGNDNFIYTATGRTTANATGQIKMLNPGGEDVSDTSDINFADTEIVLYASKAWYNQDLSQLAADGEFIYVLDKGNGKIYLYDNEGSLLGAFGGGTTYGDVKGTFQNPIAITLNGDDVLVCDKAKCSLTVYKITEYGKLVKECQSMILNSQYVEAKEGWEEVLRQDSNSQLAYRGLGKAYFREGDYKTSMEYAKIGADRDTYSESYKYVRKEIIADNFYWAFPLMILLVVGVIGAFFYVKKKEIQLVRNRAIRHWAYSLAHPFDAFRAIKENGMGSVTIGTVLVALLYITSVLKVTKGGFIYTYFDSANFNSLFILVKTVGIVVLWTIVNWAVCTLMHGLGKMKEIYIVITYSLTPLIISNVLYLVFTNVLYENEAEFLGIMVAVFWIYTIFLVMAGSIKIHDIGFGKFVATSVLTILGIAIVIFLVFLLFLLIQQLGSFLLTLFYEIIYR